MFFIYLISHECNFIKLLLFIYFKLLFLHPEIYFFHHINIPHQMDQLLLEVFFFFLFLLVQWLQKTKDTVIEKFCVYIIILLVKNLIWNRYCVEIPLMMFFFFFLCLWFCADQVWLCNIKAWILVYAQFELIARAIWYTLIDSKRMCIIVWIMSEIIHNKLFVKNNFILVFIIIMAIFHCVRVSKKKNCTREKDYLLLFLHQRQN